MDQHDFNYGILNDVSHRPWPMPDGPWVMTQTWHDLLFAHWPVSRAALTSAIPPSLPLDVHDGQAWLGVVPFHMTNVAPRGVPAVPWVSAFPELNVRTYVTFRGKPGVYFFSLDAANPIAVGIARLLHLPYFTAAMRVERDSVAIKYQSSRTTVGHEGEAEFNATYVSKGTAAPPAAGTLEYFLTERYCLYTTNRRGRVRRLNIHHPPWPLQSAEAEFRVNTMTKPLGIDLPTVAPLLHFAVRQDMVAWLPEAANR